MDIISIITNYILNDRLEGAILINGEWGVGKSYYIRNKVIPKIEELKSSGKNGNKYQCLYISLNGLQDINEIYDRIALSKLPWLKKKTSKIVISVGAAFLGILSKLPKIMTDIGDQSTNPLRSLKLEDFLNLEDHVLCFDDLERIGNRLSVTEVLGHINTNFIETNKVKTIIIANEKEIPENISSDAGNDRHAYSIVKEKVINRVILFSEQQIDFREIINRYGDSKQFHNTLLLYEKYIKSIITGHNHKNLRTIIFALDNIQQIFDAQPDIVKQDTLTKSILLFTFLISFELKSGQISVRHLDWGSTLKDLSSHLSVLAAQGKMNSTFPEKISDSEKEAINYAISFFEKYNLERSSFYTFFTSLFKLILTGELINDQLAAEIQEFLTNQEDAKTSQNNENIRDLLWTLARPFDFDSHEELVSAFTHILQLAQDGELKYNNYPEIIDIVESLYANEFIINNLDFYKIILVEGLKKSIAKRPEIQHSVTEHLRKRYQKCSLEEVNELIHSEWDRLDQETYNKEIKEFFHLLSNDNHLELKNEYFNPLAYITATNFFDTIKYFNCHQWRKFREYIGNLLKDDGFRYCQNLRKTDLDQLIHLIEDHRNQVQDKVMRLILNVIIKDMKSITEKITPTS